MHLGQSVKYATETARYYPAFYKHMLTYGARDSKALSMTGSAVFSAAMYDLATAHGPSNHRERRQARLFGGLGMLHFDLVDDAIDDPTLELTQTQKVEELALLYVASGWCAMQNSALSEHLPSTSYFRTAVKVGQSLGQVVTSNPSANSYRDSVGQFYAAEAMHGFDPSSDGLLNSMIEVGLPCGNIMSSAVELARREPSLETVKAAEALAVIGMCYDHAYEINEDIEAGSQSFTTAYITENGDSLATRREAREALMDTASSARRSGIELLTTRQIKIFDAMSRLFELRYKMVVAPKDRLKGARMQKHDAQPQTI